MSTKYSSLNIAGCKPCEGFILSGEAIDNIEAKDKLERA